MWNSQSRCSDRLYHHTPTYIPIPSLTASALKRIVNITTASRRVSLISSSQPVKYVTPSSGKGRETMVPCRPASACVHSPQTSRCARRRRVGMKEVLRHMPILRLCIHSQQTRGGKPSVLRFSSERWSLARSPLTQPAGLSIFRAFLAFGTLVLLLFYFNRIENSGHESCCEKLAATYC